MSHDQEEVFRLSDQIAVMHHGKIERFGTREDVFADPRTKSAARLTGYKNVSRIEAIDEKTVFASDWGVSLPIAPGLPPKCHAAIRMREIQAASAEDGFEVRVVSEIENPFTTTLSLRPTDGRGTKALLWEVDKGWWNANRAGTVRIELPFHRIALLSD